MTIRRRPTNPMIAHCGRRVRARALELARSLGELCGASLFATAVFLRWRQRVGILPGVSHMFVRPGSMILHRDWRQNLYLSVSPQLIFANAGRPATHASPDSIGIPVTMSSPEISRVRPISSANVQIVNRVLMRSEKRLFISIDKTVKEHPVSSSSTPDARVFRVPRPASVETPVACTSPPQALPMTGSRAEPQRSFAGQSIPELPAANNVERLADQVLRTIDKRIVAQRERLGRI